jgi:LytS/YehU family sensor histidine kinase
MASLDLGSGGGVDTLSGITNFLQDGGSAARILTSSIVGILVAPVVGTIDVINAVADFATAPFEGAGESISTLFDGLLTGPAELIEAGARVSENSITAVFGAELGGILALPLTVALALASLYLLATFLDEEETGNLFPGLPFDVPIIGADEEPVDDV